jgi:hypothetical protein
MTAPPQSHARHAFPTRWVLAGALAIFLMPENPVGQELGQYREFRLGSSVEHVAAAAGTSRADLETVHTRPALLQRLTWRPRYSGRRIVPDVDPVREVVFSFHNDELASIAVEYEPVRTAGMTTDDLVAALTALYGAPAVSHGSERGASTVNAPPDQMVSIADWRDGDATMALQWSPYRQGYSLRVISLRREALARDAAAEAVALDKREAPAREAARARQDADDARAARERERQTNKEVFRP